MSKWLQKRLVWWFGGALALLLTAGAAQKLQAQDDFRDLLANPSAPRPKLGRDEAAREFVRLLQMAEGGRYTNVLGRETPEQLARLSASIAPQSERELKMGVEELVYILADQWKRPAQKVVVQNESTSSAIVRVEDDPTPPARPFVLREENGAWGVDLVETYARWNNLQGIAKAEAIFFTTGVVLPELEGSPTFVQAREKGRLSSCQSNLKQIALGVKMYVQDWDEKFPLARSWQDALSPYTKSEVIFNCPSLPEGKTGGYAYNSRLNNVREYALFSISETALLYETSAPRRNAFGYGFDLANRHLDGANFAYADGHVKWISKTAPKPTFLLNPPARR